jgi:hypothetical protein
VNKLPWLVGGGALAYWWARGEARAPRNIAAMLSGRWVWPVASWNGRPPAISDGFHSPRRGLPRHGGVDIMFPRAATDPFGVGTSNGTKFYVMPDDQPVLAASDGVVWSAMKTPRGNAVVIDHGPRRVATFYTHLDRMLVTPTARGASQQRVSAGQMIGTVGYDPLDVRKLRHLHFELWLGGPSERVDPMLAMSVWDVMPDPRTTAVARNAGFSYRPVGAAGEAYPQWVRDLKDQSGVYVIRENGETVYVGSSVGRLYDTLTRHFQTWRRYKGFWRGQYGEGHDPGLTYPRDRVEVAVRLTKPSDALDEEARLIRRLRPRDNLIGQPIEEEVPF